jgi:hypothetical protein
MPKKKTLVRSPWTKDDIRQLKTHSKAKTPVVEVAKAMKRLRLLSGRRRRQSALVSVIAVEDCHYDGSPKSGGPLSASIYPGGLRFALAAIEVVGDADLTLTLLLPARESKRPRVTPHEAIRADQLRLGRAIEAGLVLRRMDRRDRRGEPSIDGSFAENAGHYRWSIRLTIRGRRTNIEHGGLRINSLKSPSLRDTPGTLMPARTSP